MFNFQKKEKKEPKNIKEVLEEISSLDLKFKKVTEELDSLKNNQSFSVQKIAITRYNPFKDVGGDQSFTLVLLDKNDSGIVLTSLYNREGSRIYGKAIKNGISEYALSEEEKKIIEKVKNQNEQ
jgi:hypothetical protein